MEEAIRVEARDGWRLITLNRPERMNALNAAALHGLTAALEDVARDPTCRALLITGAGRAFCAGADLSALTPGADRGDKPPADRGANPRADLGANPRTDLGADLGDHPPADLGADIERTWNPTARALQAVPVPTVCAVNGVAAGAGANFALGCDIVLAARSALFVQAFSKIGLVPDCGGTHHLPRLIGEARARAVALLAEPIGAEQAEAWGMIWRAVDDATLMADAESLTARLAAGPTQAYVLTRRALAAAAGNTLDRQLDVERDLQREAGFTPDFAEGVRAFLEKRPPVFTGRPRS